MKIKWKCRYCGDVKVSDSKDRHQMDFCKCRKTGVDLEGEYSRYVGKPYIYV